jgi:hypothetical protein
MNNCQQRGHEWKERDSAVAGNEYICINCDAYKSDEISPLPSVKSSQDKMFSFQGMMFDDFFIPDDLIEDCPWAPICTECVERYKVREFVGTGNPQEDVICGVSGCANEAEEYINLEVK